MRAKSVESFVSVSWEKTTFTEFSHDLSITVSAAADSWLKNGVWDRGHMEAGGRGSSGRMESLVNFLTNTQNIGWSRILPIYRWQSILSNLVWIY